MNTIACLRRAVSAWILSTTCVIGWAAPGVTPQDAAKARALAELPVADLTGTLRTVASLAPVGGPWVLAVVDIQVVQSQALLESLQAGAGDGSGVVVLVSGPPAGAAAFARRHAERLPAAVWLSVDARELRRALPLPAMPALLGIEASGVPGWTYIGVPPRKGQAEAMVRDWRSRLPAPVKDK